MVLFKKLKKSKGGIVDIDVNLLVEKKRSPTGTQLLIVNIIGFGMALFHMYCAGFKTIDVMQFRATHTALGLCILFLLYPLTKKSSRVTIPWYDWLIAVIAMIPNFYIVLNFKELAARAGRVTMMDAVMGLLLMIVILEAARRVVGLTLVFIASFFIVYTMYGAYFPGVLAHRGASISSLVRHMILSTEGLFGVALGASASFIFLFCLLGAVMSEIEADGVLIDLAIAAFGKQRGGPAKAAVVSSALFGTVSGSSLANVTTTGTFTIPLMKSVGYEPEFAGAVEATASCGGQIMPPVMGAAAFIIAEFTGSSYLAVCFAAALPALLYFTGIFSAVHVRAYAKGLKGVPEDQLPDAKKLMLEKGYLLLPLVSIIGILMAGMSPSMAAFISVCVTIAVSFLKRETRMNPQRLFVSFASGAKGAVDVMIACAIVGFIVGSFTLTGLGVKMATLVTTMARGSLLLTLLFSAMASIVLGMGVPTTANYIMMSMITVPAVSAMGVPIMAAHLFCFYFGIVSDLTPPVAMAALTGAGIAKAKFWPTAINATKLGVAAFIVPFFFVYNPVLLLGQQPFSITVVVSMLFSIVGIIAVSCGLFGYVIDDTTLFERVIMIAAGLLMVLPEPITSIIGLGMVAFVVFKQKMRVPKEALPL
jgi:TRAP transporter 4TM/12TM fusion protein